MRWYLGSHEPSWLTRTKLPLFISHTRLQRRRQLPRAQTTWALDSGGFTQITNHGAYTTTPQQYAQDVGRYAQEIGQLQWAAIQDWMCEPAALTRSGLSIRQHQQRTTDSYHALRDAAPELPWIPVIQGYALPDYQRHADHYATAGDDLSKLPLVGLGSICRRQDTAEVGIIIRTLAAGRFGLHLHAFGLKLKGARNNATWLTSTDSLAWSLHARRRPAHFPECTHRSCANCLRYAEHWYRTRVSHRPTQLPLL